LRRLLKAAGERDDPVDVLVDAVVAWENLFGSTRTRSTAHPIEDTVEKKAERARSLFCVDHRAHNATS
jgi:hypothetical protein